MLRTAFYALKRDAAPGVDGMTWEAYERDLDRRIEDLHAQVKSGAYRALPSRRSYIPKKDGSKRPLAVAALEDKIVQRAMAAVLSAIHEEDFLGFSYGFRPKRSQHDALDALIVGISSKKVNFILGRRFPSNGLSASLSTGSATRASSGSSRNGCEPVSSKTGS